MVGVVAVVGGGAAGLVTGKRLLEEGFEVVIFEKSHKVGGTWAYSDDTNVDTCNAMYYNLTTNLSKNTMAFIDYPFPKKYPSLMKHSQVQEYLENYAQEFDLFPYIRLHHKIVSIVPTDPFSPCVGKYKVIWEVNGEREESLFDFVAVCNGHYSKPYIPPIKGIQYFSGDIIHSKYYRKPEKFVDQNVMVIGRGASADDISQDLLSQARKVYYCLGKDLKRYSSNDKLGYYGELSHVDKDGNIIMKNGQTLDDVHTIIYCTGYYFHFEFLDESMRISVKFKEVCDLFLHMFPFNRYHPQYPSLFRSSQKEETIPPTIVFIGLPLKIVPFPLYDHQAQCTAAVWKRKAVLPLVKTILTSMNANKKLLHNYKLPSHYSHYLLTGQHKYTDELIAIRNSPPGVTPPQTPQTPFTKQYYWLVLFCALLFAIYFGINNFMN